MDLSAGRDVLHDGAASDQRAAYAHHAATARSATHVAHVTSSFSFVLAVEVKLPIAISTAARRLNLQFTTTIKF